MDKNLLLKVKSNTYEIVFPNVGKFQRIESLKQVISNGMYHQLLSTPTISSYEAMDMIDIEAYFTILAPKLVEDMKCESFSDLGLEDYLELKEVYKEQFVPWWSNIIDLINPQKKD